MCRGHIDDVHFVVVDERRVIAVAACGTVAGSERCGAPGVTCRNGGDDVAAGQVDVTADGVGNTARAEDAPANRTVIGNRCGHCCLFPCQCDSRETVSPDAPRRKSWSAPVFACCTVAT